MGSLPCLSAGNADNQLFESTTPDFTPKDVKSGIFVFIQMENKILYFMNFHSSNRKSPLPNTK